MSASHDIGIFLAGVVIGVLIAIFGGGDPPAPQTLLLLVKDFGGTLCRTTA